MGEKIHQIRGRLGIDLLHLFRGLSSKTFAQSEERFDSTTLVRRYLSRVADIELAKELLLTAVLRPPCLTIWSIGLWQRDVVLGSDNFGPPSYSCNFHGFGSLVKDKRSSENGWATRRADVQRTRSLNIKRNSIVGICGSRSEA
jgi:hypothetical protein